MIVNENCSCKARKAVAEFVCTLMVHTTVGAYVVPPKPPVGCGGLYPSPFPNLPGLGRFGLDAFSIEALCLWQQGPPTFEPLLRPELPETQL